MFILFCLRRRKWKWQDVSRRGSTVSCMVFSRIRWPGTILLRGHVFRIVFRQSHLHAPSRRTATRRLFASSRVRYPKPPAPRIRCRSLRTRDTTTAISLVRATQLRRHHQGLRSPAAPTAVPRRKVYRRVRGTGAHGQPCDHRCCDCDRREIVGRCVAAANKILIILDLYPFPIHSDVWIDDDNGTANMMRAEVIENYFSFSILMNTIIRATIILL